MVLERVLLPILPALHQAMIVLIAQAEALRQQNQGQASISKTNINEVANREGIEERGHSGPAPKIKPTQNGRALKMLTH